MTDVSTCSEVKHPHTLWLWRSPKRKDRSLSNPKRQMGKAVSGRWNVGNNSILKRCLPVTHTLQLGSCSLTPQLVNFKFLSLLHVQNNQINYSLKSALNWVSSCSKSHPPHVEFWRLVPLCWKWSIGWPGSTFRTVLLSGEAVCTFHWTDVWPLSPGPIDPGWCT